MTTPRAADGRTSPTQTPAASAPPPPSMHVPASDRANHPSCSEASSDPASPSPGALGPDGPTPPGRSTRRGRLIDVDDPWPAHPSGSLAPGPNSGSRDELDELDELDDSTGDDESCVAGDLADDRAAHAFMLAAALLDERGPVSGWRHAPRREGPACAVIDAIMTPRVTSETVDAVVMRFGMRYGCDADLPTLARSVDDLGGERWRREIGTNHRTHSRHDAPYKADVIAEAAHVLVSADILTSADLRRHADDEHLRGSWIALPGQSSGFTWRHLLLAVGHETPQVCSLTRCFVRRHLPREVAALPAGALLDLMQGAADHLGVSVLDVDHQMWRAAVMPRARRARDDAPRPAAPDVPPVRDGVVSVTGGDEVAPAEPSRSRAPVGAGV